VRDPGVTLEELARLTAEFSPGARNFELELEHGFVCLACGRSSAVREPFRQLSLEVPRSPDGGEVRLDALLEEFFREEEIERTCEHCGHRRSRQRHWIARLPRLLILHLKRFRIDPPVPPDSAAAPTSPPLPAQPSKISTRVRFPLQLRLADELCLQETRPPPPLPYPPLPLPASASASAASASTSASSSASSPATDSDASASPPPEKRARSETVAEEERAAEKEPAQASVELLDVDAEMGEASEEAQLRAALELSRREAEAACRAEEAELQRALDASLRDHARAEARRTATPEECVYELQALVCHIGASAAYGHYVADVREAGGWRRYDDSVSEEFPESGLQSDERLRTAYLLFYANRAALPHPAPPASARPP
jgi:hypothetical protein